jgi:hypothetical protein
MEERKEWKARQKRMEAKRNGGYGKNGRTERRTE